MTKPLPKHATCYEYVQHDDEIDKDSVEGCWIEKGHVCGLDVESTDRGDQCGELVVESVDGMLHTFSICATHQIPIPKDAYTLLGGDAYKDNVRIPQKYWAVG